MPNENPIAAGGHGLGINSYQQANDNARTARRNRRAHKLENAAKKKGEGTLTSGTLNGTDWSWKESVTELRAFAIDEGLEGITSRSRKGEIVSALSQATKAQG